MSEVLFDHDAVLEALKRAVLDAWQRLQSLEPAEQVYGLLLYEGAEYGYVCVTGFTEEGLDRVAAQYRRGELSMASGICPEAVSGSARWWPSVLPGGGQ